MFSNRFGRFDVDSSDSSGEWAAVKAKNPLTDFGLLVLSSLLALVAGISLGWLILN